MHFRVRVVFVFVQKEEQKNEEQKTETLLTCISETARTICFIFGM